MMKVFDFFLILCLSLQIFLWVNHEETSEDIQNLVRPKLDFKDIVEIEISQGKGLIRFKKDREDWGLSAYKGYPLQKRSAESFLARVTGYFPGPIVGTVADSAKQFRVSDDKPYYRIRLQDKRGFDHTLFIAPAIGNSDYVRLKGDDNIYRLEPALSKQLDTSPQAWIEPTLYQMKDVPKAINWTARGGREFRVRYDGRDFRHREMVLDRNKVIQFVNDLQTLPIDEPWGVVDPYSSQKPPLDLFFDIPGQPIRLHVYPQVHPQTGVQGFRVSLDGDLREVFVMPHRFKGLFQFDIGIFLPGNVAMGNPNNPFVNPLGK